LSASYSIAQAPAKWSVNGNTAVSGDFLGTTNNEDLVFKTNNTIAFKIKANGNIIVKSLESLGSGLVTVDNNGKLIHSAFSGDINQVLLGDGTFGALPSGLWTTGTGGKIYYNGGKVGIGTATPNFKLDVDGDVRITQNLYLQGELVISDKIQTPKQMKAGSIIVDSLLMDSTRAVYGVTNFKDDVKLASKLSVNGSALINGTATVNGDLKTMGSLKIGGSRSFSYVPGVIGGEPGVFSMGSPDGIISPAPPFFYDDCDAPAPLVPTTLYQFPGLIQSYANVTSGSAPVSGVLTMGFDGVNGLIDLAGPITPAYNPRLLINYNCGKDVYINTGAKGGNINMCTGANAGVVSMCAGLKGKVGVGTETPLAKFDVQNDDASGITASITKVEPGRIRRIIFEPKLNTGDYNYLTQADDIGIIWTDGAPSTISPSNGFVLAPWGSIGTAYQFPGLRMTKEGFIGIGTPFPQAMMEIQNGEYVGGTGIRNPIGFKVTSTYTNNPELGVGILCQVGDNLSKTFSSGKTDGTTYTENFVVYGDGYVFARDIRVTLQTPFVHPDYVFEKNYKLKSLEDIEMFIQQNGHLPNIPTASDVEKNKGINLGEMSEKQLEKIEELTLYIIELNKKMNELTKTVEVQNEKIKILEKK